MRPPECTQLQKCLHEKIIKETLLADLLITSLIHMNSKLPFFVGFDIAKIAGLVEVEFLRASKTYIWKHVFSRGLVGSVKSKHTEP